MSERGIGGFLGLEVGAPAPRPHADATWLSTGRAALAAIVALTRPTAVWAPSWICADGLPHEVPVRRYPLRRDLGPDLPDPAPGELVIVVDYFGLVDAPITRAAEALGDRLVVDATQAFFRGQVPGSWSYGSARKTFGVPDGAWLYGPRPVPAPTRANRAVDANHLLLRLVGHPGALAAFHAHEARLGAEPLAPSPLAQVLLDRLDATEVARRRRDNWAVLHQALGDLDTLGLPLPAGAVPLAFPFLPARPVPHAALRAEGIWIPQLWPTGVDRSDPRADRLARELLPLPLDQRYGPEHMQRVADVVRRLCG